MRKKVVGKILLGEPISFVDLVGEAVLDGVDQGEEAYSKEWDDQEVENCSTIYFRLDGIVFCAIEDPSDGYRSSMREFRTSAHKIKNTFQPIGVLCRINPGEKSGDAENEILEMLDLKNGKTVLEVGTDHSDNYYPSFVAHFIPEAMSINYKE